MTRPRALAVALVAGAIAMLGIGMPGPASPAVAEPSMVEPGCVVRDATLSWGFKESFRAYIDGDIANGEWTTSRGATYETPEFAWSNGQGRYDRETGLGFVNFLGTVRFTGHDGLLDTTIADPTVMISADGAFLLLDVSGPSMEGEQIAAQDVSFVELTGVEVSGAGARLTLDSDTVLTADGEAAFPDYPPGTEFDPMSVALELDMCSPPGGYAGGDDISPPAVPPLLVAAAIAGPVLLIAAIVTAIVIAVRRRARA